MTRHLYQNSECIYCAESLDQCWELYEKDTGLERAHEENDPFVQLLDDTPLEIACEDPTGDPGEIARPLKAGGKTIWYFNTRTAGEWAAGWAPGQFSGE